MNYRIGKNTEFEVVHGSLRLTRLFGLDMEPKWWIHERSVGIFNVFASLSCYRPKLVSAEVKDNEFNAVFEADGRLRYVSRWRFEEGMRMASRQDYVENISQDGLVLNRAVMHFVMRNDGLNSFYQNNISCQENIGKWRKVEHGGFCLSCDEGRLTGGATPFLALKDRKNEGLVFHLVPNGNWEITLKTQNFGIGNAGENYVEIELGQRQKQFAMTLRSGERFYLPRLLVQDISGGLVNSTVALHRYFLTDGYELKKDAPIGFNTWFDINDTMIAKRLEEHLAVAKELGFELFTIDAGWFGGTLKDRGWYDQVGDWSEKGDESFGMSLTDFSAKVRACGLKFGLWIEPERVSEFTSFYREHPEYFTLGDNGGDPKIFHKFRIYEEEPYRYVKSLLCGLIEKYDLSWVKVDFNYELYYDETFSESYQYYRAWNKLIAEVSALYPQTIIEGCASGGMRSDLNSFKNFDVHFLNDNINLWDALASYIQGALRLPFWKVNRWCGIKRGADEEYGADGKAERRERVIVPSGCGAGWGQAERVDVDFACAMAFGCVMTFTGDLRGLSEAQKEIVKKYVAFQKKYRSIYAGSVLHFESDEFMKVGDREGTVFMQYHNEKEDISFLHAYKFLDCGGRRFKLKNLDKSKNYRVFDPVYGIETGIFTGEDLCENGIEIPLNGDHCAKILCAERV